MNTNALIQIIACAFLAASAYASESETCSLQNDQDIVSASIKLKSHTGSQNFYFRLGSFVAFISAQDLEIQLKSQVAMTGLTIDAALAQDIARDTMVGGQVDLFRYVLSNPKYLKRLEFIIARSIDVGVVSLVDIRGRPKMEDVNLVKRISYSDSLLKKRIYCAADTDVVLDITDAIA